MGFDVDAGRVTDRGPRAVDDHFAALRRSPAGDSAPGLVVASADGVSAGGEGRMAAQTRVLAPVEDFSLCLPPVTLPWCSTG
jgi:hypothetical protein